MIDVLAGVIIFGGFVYLISNGFLLEYWVKEYLCFVSAHQIPPCPGSPRKTKHAGEQIHGLFSGHGHGLHQHPDAGPGSVHLLWGERGELEIT